MSYKSYEFQTGADLEGTTGNDVLKGNATTTVEGKGGNDIFVLSNEDNIITVEDFEQGGDKLFLEKSVFAAATGKIENVTTLPVGDTYVAGTLYFNTTDSTLYYAQDTSTANAKPIAKLNNFTGNLTASDFIFGKMGAAGASKKDDLIFGDAASNDGLVGGKGNDTLYGFAEKDTLKGDAGNDVLFGGAGDDELDGGTGVDALIGGAGNDTYLVDDAADKVIEKKGEGEKDLVKSSISYTLGANVENLELSGNGNINGTGNAVANEIKGNGGANLLKGEAGNDTLDGGVGNDTLFGGVGDDILQVTGSVAADKNALHGGKGDDKLIGGDGKDTLNGGVGDDTMTGGAGDDLLVVDSADDSIDGGDGNDTALVNVEKYKLGNTTNVEIMQLGKNIVEATGSDKAETIMGNAKDNKISGGGEADTLYGLAGNDTLADASDKAAKLFGGTGDDVYVVSHKDTEVNETAEEGIDTVVAKATGITLGKNVENAKADGAAGIAVTGNKMDNMMTSGEQADTLNGAEGNDTLRGAEGNDTLNGGEDHDQLFGGQGADVLNGGAGKDILKGGAGADALNGGEGDDMLYGNQDKDVLKGGAGNDSLFAGQGNDDLQGEAGDDVLYGRLGDDTLDGGDGRDMLYGNQGDDTLKGGKGADVITAGKGDDILEGGDDNDVLFGRKGDDDLKGEKGNDILRGNQGDDTLDGGDGDDQLFGGLGEDELKGDKGNDLLFGREGADKLNGGEGKDVLRGNQGADVLNGEDGDDSLFGGKGEDVLTGGKGKDLLAGGTGKDTFIFDSALDAEKNVDTIADFKSGEDRVQLKKAIFEALGVGELDASMFAANADGVATDEKDRIIYNTTTGALLYDADGKGGDAAVQFATLANKPADVKATDFVVVS